MLHSQLSANCRDIAESLARARLVDLGRYSKRLLSFGRVQLAVNKQPSNCCFDSMWSASHTSHRRPNIFFGLCMSIQFRSRGIIADPARKQEFAPTDTLWGHVFGGEAIIGQRLDRKGD